MEAQRCAAPTQLPRVEAAIPADPDNVAVQMLQHRILGSQIWEAAIQHAGKNNVVCFRTFGAMSSQERHVHCLTEGCLPVGWDRSLVRLVSAKNEDGDFAIPPSGNLA